MGQTGSTSNGSETVQWLRAAQVLVADHDHFRRPATCSAMRAAGAQLIGEVADGLSAVDAIRRCDPDLVVLRWDLPVFDGMQVIQIVRAPGVFKRPHVPILVLASEGRPRPHPLPYGVSELVAGTATSIEDFRDRLIRAIENLRGSRPGASAPAGKVAQPA